MNNATQNNAVRILKVETCDFGDVECQCCGRKIAKVHMMANGLMLGSECAAWLEWPTYRIGRKPTKKLAALATACGITF